MNLIENNQLTMSTREIARLLNNQHSHVKKSAERLCKKGTIALRESNYEHSGNQYAEYLLNKRDSMILVAQNNPEFTAAIVDRWQELENQQPKQPVLPANYIEALESLIASEKEKAALAEQIEQQKPAVSFVADYVEASTGSKTFREVAKLLKENERELRAFLVENKIMYKQAGTWYAYALHQDAGRFEVKTGVKNGYSFNTTLFTAKGFTWLAGEIGKKKALALV